MANIHNNLSELFTDIADAIRSKTGSTDPIVADEFPTAIEAIEVGGGGEEWIGDGNTHIWISLAEGRTKPKLGLGVQGTVTVDWGDGTSDTVTGTSTSTTVFTPHQYARSGDYIITVSGDGAITFRGASSSGSHVLVSADNVGSFINEVYCAAVKKVECGDNVSQISDGAFSKCVKLESVKNLPIANIGAYAFYYCHNLKSIDIPDGVTKIGGYAFYCCYALDAINIPESVGSVGTYAFYYGNETKLIIPTKLTLLDEYFFSHKHRLTEVIALGAVVTIRNNAFNGNYGVCCYDFTKCTSVPSLGGTNAFYAVPTDCVFKIPASLYDEWIAATNWSAIADKCTFVGV